ncbi:MAG TPA: alkaline phosphatase family protein [Armatimonadota bacterium]
MGVKNYTFKIIVSIAILTLLTGACTAGPAPTLSPATAVSLPATAAPVALPSALPTTTPVTRPAVTQGTPSVTGQAATPAQPSPVPTLTTATPATAPAAGTAPAAKVPVFSHVMLIVLENHEYGGVIGNSTQMPVFNQLAGENTLLTHYYAVSHPSLPNYIALVSGDTQGITTDCTNCFVNATNLADLLNKTNLTWKTYQEDMPSPCFVGSASTYAQKHNPFIYFNDLRTDAELCQANVVPLTQLDTDLANGVLPNFSFIMPNLCNSAHDCGLDVADRWLGAMITKLTSAKSYDANSLIIVTFDEGQGNHSCCGLPKSAGGQVATLLISPLAKAGFQDPTPYSHYSILKTLSAAWGIPELGHAADPETNVIQAPWK